MLDSPLNQLRAHGRKAMRQAVPGALLRLLGKGGPQGNTAPGEGVNGGPGAPCDFGSLSLLKLKYSELIYNVVPILEWVSFNNKHEGPHLPGMVRWNRFCRVPSGWDDVYRTTRALQNTGHHPLRGHRIQSGPHLSP